MAGIGAIGGGYSPYSVSPPRQSAEAIGSRLAGALGTKSGLGESASADSVADNGDERASGIAGASEQLTDEEQKQVQELKQRDQEVRQHEQAHVAAAGRYAQGGPQFEFTTGPDGRQYATGGHVNIDVSPAATPEATIQKAQVIRRAAQAPAEPSGQDRAVAGQASQLESAARKELQEAQQSESEGGSEEAKVSEGSPAAESPLNPPPALSRRAISEYQPPASNGGGGASGVGRLDLSV